MSLPREPRSGRNRGGRSGTPVRMSFSIDDALRGQEILTHLTEERLIAGGTVIEAHALHWVGGSLQRDTRRVVSAYTTLGKLPLIRGRLETLYGEEVPAVSQFVMTDEKPAVFSWIERNVRE